MRTRPAISWTDLRGRRVGVWGLGVEGLASIRRLAMLGVEPVLVDVSPRMVDLWREKADRLGVQPEVEISALESFFSTDEREWDVIVFSSVLHHLEDPAGVLLGAARRLAPGGTIATIFDPLHATPIRALIRRLDYIAWLVRHSPSSLASIVGRRVGIGRSEPAGENVGAMAERHAMTGLDDRALIGALAGEGLVLIHHERPYHARLRAMRGLARILRTPTNFSLVLRKPVS
jgi:SAM-dependent methyltransferase